MSKNNSKSIAFDFSRYPKTTNRSLKVWSAADEYILRYLEDMNLSQFKTAIYHDRFGVLSCVLHRYEPYTVASYKSQEKAIRQNFVANKLPEKKLHLTDPLSPLSEKVKLGLLRIPKSLDLFRLYLQHLSQSIDAKGMVVCGFMTRYFSPKLLTIAAEFFGEVNQSKAWKKSRLLILEQPKPYQERAILDTIVWKETESLQQYFGVFSAKHIDYATQFLLENLEVKAGEEEILDLACGNGIIAYDIAQKAEQAGISKTLHLLDDAFLAIESAKLNVQGEQVHFHYKDSLSKFTAQSFDLIVSNPPFHFEYETNIEVSIGLFRAAHRCLKKRGRFVVVASKHLNFKTHLSKYFMSVSSVAENEKFVVYEAVK